MNLLGGERLVYISVPRITDTFGHLQQKLQEMQKDNVPKEKQLAVIDWWLGQLYDTRARILAGSKI